MSKTSKITNLIEFNPKRTLKKGDNAPFVEMAALPESSRDIAYVSQREFKGGGAKFQNGDTLFARITPCLENGKTAKVKNLSDGTVGHGSTEFIVMTPKYPDIDEDYVYYLARLPSFRDFAQMRMEGTSGRQRVSWQALSEFELELPTPEIRKAAGSFLRKLDDKILLNKQINQTLKQMAQAIFKSWFIDFEPVKAKMATLEAGGSEEVALFAAMQSISGKDAAALDRLQSEHPDQYSELRTTAELFPSAMQDSELGEIPARWQETTFGKVSTCFDKHRIPLSKRQREQKQGNIPYYGATSVMDYVDKHIFDGIYLLLGEDGSVLKDGGTPFVQYIWGKSWVNNHAHVLQGANGVSTEQLMCFINMQNIAAYVTGAVQLKLNQKNMNSIPFIKASDEVNEKFFKMVNPLYAQFRVLTEQSASLTTLRDSLLPKLLSGELSVADDLPQLAEAANN